MILIDSSAWVHFLRPGGDADVRQRVLVALRAGLAAWCPVVRLELWNGAGGEREKATLLAFARSCRSAGVSVPATDLLIVACAHVHAADLVHADTDFDLIVERDAGEVAPSPRPRRTRR